MAKITLTIYGDPKALKRHRRHHIKSKDGREFDVEYDPSADDKMIFFYKALSENRPEKPLEGPIETHMVFYMKRPKSHYRTGKLSHLLKVIVDVFHWKKPDGDNLQKFCWDALNGIYWNDDAQISKWSGVKIYTELQPRTEITINTL